MSGVTEFPGDEFTLWGNSLWETWNGCYGQSYFLTYRSVFWEAEQGHVSVGAAHSIVKEVRGKVGLG